MTYKYSRWIVIILALLFVSGCATQSLKKENTELKSELEQLKQDYADNKSMSAEEQQRLKDEMAAMQKDLDDRLQEQIRQNQVLIDKLDALTVVTIGEEALFGSGLAELTKEGTETIRQMTEALQKYPDYQIRVEGHSDALPIGEKLKGQYPSNWELSTARATNVVRYMIYGLHVDPARMSAAGFSHYHPVADNATAEGRAQNRRIRIVVFKGVPEE